MICYLSEVGHKNFYYATHTRAFIERGAVLEHMSWVSGVGSNKLQAVKVKKKFIIPLTLDINYVNNIMNNDEYIVVWIRKGD
jgi:hypothetical protein